MRFNYLFTKLFKVVEEGEEIRPAFVAIRKAPFEFKNIDMGEGKGKQVVSRYRCNLYINLYIAELFFSWDKNVNLAKDKDVIYSESIKR